MHLTYENTNEEIIAVKRKPRHQPPHLHNAMEIVCVTKGTLELGVGQELYHMETGDIGVVFPDVIHHYQVFSSEVNEAVFINAPQMIFGRFENVLRNKAPQYPVVKSDVIPDEVYRAVESIDVIPDEVYRAVESIIDTKQNDIWVVQAYLQIILARCIPMMKLVEKSKIGSDDIIYRTVSYISANFNKSISLDGMAHDLGVSKFSLSRLFSKTFHSSFNQYVNEARLGYACQRIETTDDTLTEISMDSGFGSLRTFNRVFKEKYRLTPSEYRNKLQK